MKTQPAPETAESRVEETPPDRQPLALEIVKRHTIYAGAIGLLPMPIINLAGVAGIQLKMLYDLSCHYQIPFREDWVKSSVSALLGGILSTNVGVGSAALVKGIPLVGYTLSVAMLPVFAGAATYAVGKVFIQHFEVGGTFLDFDPQKVKTYFQEQFQKAKTGSPA